MSEEIEYRPGQFAKKGEWRTVSQRNYRFDGKWWEPMATGHHVIGAYDTPEELFSFEMPGPLAGSLARQLQYQLDQARKERDEARRLFVQVGDILIYTEQMIGAELSNENLTRRDGTQTLPLPDNWRELVGAWAEEGGWWAHPWATA